VWSQCILEDEVYFTHGVGSEDDGTKGVAVTEHGSGHGEYFYFVDDKKYYSESSSISGAQIRAKITGLDPSYSLYLEGHADEPDQPISDQTAVSLEKEKGPRRFYTAPPATFGHE
jgi:hypothetical protein